MSLTNRIYGTDHGRGTAECAKRWHPDAWKWGARGEVKLSRVYDAGGLSLKMDKFHVDFHVFDAQQQIERVRTNQPNRCSPPFSFLPGALEEARRALAQATARRLVFQAEVALWLERQLREGTLELLGRDDLSAPLAAIPKERCRELKFQADEAHVLTLGLDQVLFDVRFRSPRACADVIVLRPELAHPAPAVPTFTYEEVLGLVEAFKREVERTEGCGCKLSQDRAYDALRDAHGDRALKQFIFDACAEIGVKRARRGRAPKCRCAKGSV